MWGVFFSSVVVIALFLYLPGFLAVRSFRLSRSEAVSFAPLVSMAFYIALSTFFWLSGVFCTGALLFAPALVVSLLAYCASSARQRVRRRLGLLSSTSNASDAGAEPGFLAWVYGIPGLVLYVVVGVAFALFVFVGGIGSPDSFVQYYDNLHHLGAIESFVVSGNWSSFDSTSYPSESFGGAPPYSDAGFYPSAWHCTAAAAASLLGVSTPIAQNASLFVFSALVLPASAHVAMSRVFPGRPDAVFFGAFAVMSFAIFPWRLISFGPLFPNLAAFAMVPAALAAFAGVLVASGPRSRKAVYSLLLVAGLISLAFTQPNGVFTLGVLSAPLIVYRASGLADRFCREGESKNAMRFGFGLAAVAAIAVVWVVCYKLPFLQGVIAYSWPAYAGIRSGIEGILKAYLISSAPQIVLGAVLLIGLACSFKERRYLWLSAAYVFVCIMYLSTAATDGFWKHFLTGFWYTDQYRIAACLALAAMPVIALSLSCIFRATAKALRFESASRGVSVMGVRALLCVVAIVFLIANCFPTYAEKSASGSGNAFESMRYFVEEGVGGYSRASLDAEERRFVEEVKSEVPEGAVIANIPHDGSAFAYGAQGLDVLYRYLDGHGGEDEVQASVVLREAMSDVACSEEVRGAAEELGVEYVLLLDADPSDQSGVYDFMFSGEDWRGILSAPEADSGFDLVLSRGDMRLYKLAA